MDHDNFDGWLMGVARQIGAYSAACMRMNNPLLRQQLAQYSAVAAEWLQDGMHGDMDYLKRMLPAKSDPWSTFPFAKSVIVLTFTNQWGDSTASHPFPLPATDALLGYISASARQNDYHSIGQAMLSELKQMLGARVRSEGVVDTSAVNERLFATVGGLGLIGGNDLLRVSDEVGARVFIGCLFVDIELPEVIRKPQLIFACETCCACLKNCPTGAIRFSEPIDARKCISYLTIEKNGLLSRQEGETIGDWLFGCDLCTTVCPSQESLDLRIPVDLEWLFKASTAEVRRTIKGSTIAYAGVTKLRRNAVAILQNKKTLQARDLLKWVNHHTGSDLIHRQINLI